MINLDFQDFRKIAEFNGKRIYYFIKGRIIELYFVSEGIFTKTVVNIEEVENKEVFFSQPIFYNALRLTFPIEDENKKQNITITIGGDGENVNIPQLAPQDDIAINETEELKNVDIQKQGVE